MNLSGIGKSKKVATPLILLAGLAFYGSAIYLNTLTQRPAIVVSAQDSAVNINVSFLKLGSFGNKRLISDLIWTRTLLQSDLEQYTKKDLNNWMLLRFRTISELDPLFYENYLYGGQFLFVVKDDLEGASFIFEKGLKIFPDDYNLNYNAGFMYYFEKQDFYNGLKKMEKIQFHPKAPNYFSSIVNKLKIETGSIDLKTLFTLVYNQYLTSPDDSLKEKLFKDLYAIKAEIDLKCLNNNNQNCDHFDFNKNRYINKKGVFHTQTPFQPYRIKKRGEYNSPLEFITTF